MAQPPVAGIHHVKIPVADLATSRRWYEDVFGLRVELEFPDEDGTVRGVAGTLPGAEAVMVALRENPAAAAAIAGFDPVGFAVEDEPDLHRWAEHLDARGIEHSPVIPATIGWLLVFADPDGMQLHLYTRARHGLDPAGRPGTGRPAPAART